MWTTVSGDTFYKGSDRSPLECRGVAINSIGHDGIHRSVCITSHNSSILIDTKTNFFVRTHVSFHIDACHSIRDD
jgi:hypothetical protein